MNTNQIHRECVSLWCRRRDNAFVKVHKRVVLQGLCPHGRQQWRMESNNVGKRCTVIMRKDGHQCIIMRKQEVNMKYEWGKTDHRGITSSNQWGRAASQAGACVANRRAATLRWLHGRSSSNDQDVANTSAEVNDINGLCMYCVWVFVCECVWIESVVVLYGCLIFRKVWLLVWVFREKCGCFMVACVSVCIEKETNQDPSLKHNSCK